MLGLLNISSFCLAVGAIGQYWFRRLLPDIPSWIILSVICLPWIIAFAATFTKQSPLSNRGLRACLLIVMCWYLGITVAAEVMNHFKPLPPDGHFSITTARILMYAGLLGFIPFARACIHLGRAQNNLRK